MANTPTAWISCGPDALLRREPKGANVVDRRSGSGCLNVAKQGLEVSVLGYINVELVHTFVLDATQTPAGLSAKEAATYSRIDFYLEQVLDCVAHLKAITYFVADGFYAKTKFIDGLVGHNKHLITKLRADAKSTLFI